MRSLNWKTVSTLVTMLLIAGCSDRATGPSAGSSAPVSMMMAPTDAPQLGLNGQGGGNTSADFTVGPWGGTYLVGNHAVVFPAGSICDPASSSYGPDTWNDSCRAATTPIRIHAEVRTTKAGTWVDFTPSLRFVPSNSPAKWVWIFMYTPQVTGASDLSRANILFTSGLGASGIDESATDATLRTYVDTRSGISMRRIKHFSGYSNSSGRACDPATESDCTANPVQGGP